MFLSAVFLSTQIVGCCLAGVAERGRPWTSTSFESAGSNHPTNEDGLFARQSGLQPGAVYWAWVQDDKEVVPYVADDTGKSVPGDLMRGSGPALTGSSQIKEDRGQTPMRAGPKRLVPGTEYGEHSSIKQQLNYDVLSDFGRGIRYSKPTGWNRGSHYEQPMGSNGGMPVPSQVTRQPNVYESGSNIGMAYNQEPQVNRRYPTETSNPPLQPYEVGSIEPINDRDIGLLQGFMGDGRHIYDSSLSSVAGGVTSVDSVFDVNPNIASGYNPTQDTFSSITPISPKNVISKWPAASQLSNIEYVRERQETKVLESGGPVSAFADSPQYSGVGSRSMTTPDEVSDTTLSREGLSTTPTMVEEPGMYGGGSSSHQTTRPQPVPTKLTSTLSPPESRVLKNMGFKPDALDGIGTGLGILPTRQSVSTSGPTSIIKTNASPKGSSTLRPSGSEAEKLLSTEPGLKAPSVMDYGTQPQSVTLRPGKLEIVPFDLSKDVFGSIHTQPPEKMGVNIKNDMPLPEGVAKSEITPIDLSKERFVKDGDQVGRKEKNSIHNQAQVITGTGIKDQTPLSKAPAKLEIVPLDLSKDVFVKGDGQVGPTQTSSTHNQAPEITGTGIKDQMPLSKAPAKLEIVPLGLSKDVFVKGDGQVGPTQTSSTHNQAPEITGTVIKVAMPVLDEPTFQRRRSRSRVDIPLSPNGKRLFGTITIGTAETGAQEQHLSALFDTACSHLWVAAKGSGGLDSSPVGGDTFVKRFDRKLSPSYETQGASAEQQCGTATLEGTWAFDLVKLGTGDNSIVLSKQGFGEARIYDDAFENYDVIFGLDIVGSELPNGEPDPPLAQIHKQFGTVPVFGYYINRVFKDRSKLVIGGNDEEFAVSAFNSHALVPTLDMGQLYYNGWNVLLGRVEVGGRPVPITSGTLAHPDTGNTVITGPQDLMDNINDAIFQKSSLQYDSAEFTFSCDPDTMVDVHTTFPDVTFVIDKKKYTLKSYDYIQETDGLCRSAFVGDAMNFVLLGGVFMQKYYTRFDYMNKQIQFAKARQDFDDVAFENNMKEQKKYKATTKRPGRT